MPNRSISKTRLVVLTVACVGLVVAIVAGVGLWTLDDGPTGELSSVWVTDTATEYDGNHHDVATTTVDGEPIVGIPRSDYDGSERCGIVAVDGAGDIAWQHAFPPEHCTPHAIGDLTVGTRTPGGRPAFYAGTEQETVLGFDVATGEKTFEHGTSSLGFSEPVVADLTGDGGRELVVVDFAGLLQVVRPDGTTAWSTDVGRSVLVDPVVADVTGDGAAELVVSSRPEDTRGGAITVFDAAGSRLWDVSLDRPSTSVAAVPGSDVRIVVATRDGTVAGLGATGERVWSGSLDDRGTVGATDGETAYVSTPDGTVRALDVTDGSVRWRRSVTGEVQQLSPPVRADVTGDGSSEIAVAGSDGTVAVLDASGDVVAQHATGEPIHVSPAFADVTGDGSLEVLVLYGDGRLAAYAYEDS